MIRLLNAAYTGPPTPDDQYDALAGVHLLAGLEPGHIYEVDKKNTGAVGS